MNYRDNSQRSIGPSFETHTIVSLTRMEENQRHHTRMLQDLLEGQEKPPRKLLPEWMTPAFLMWLIVAILGTVGNLSADQLKLLLTTLPR